MQTEPRQTSQKRNKRWAVVTCAVLFLVLAPALVGYLFWARALPDWSPPPRPLPENNAYDEYAAAAGTIPAPTDARDYGSRNAPISLLREVVSENQTALDRIRAAFELPCVVPLIYSVHQMIPELSKLRHAARLFAAEARIAEAEGRTGEAAQHCLDAIELGGDMSRDTGVLYVLVGDGACTIGARRLHGLVPQLDAADSRQALERLNRIDRDWGALRGVVEAERIQVLSWLHEIWAKDSVFHYLRDEWVEILDPELVVEAARAELYPRRVAQRNIERHFDRWLAAVEPPLDLDADEHPVGDPLGDYLVPVMSRLIVRSAEASVERDLLRLMLALRVHQQRHGAYPKTLEPLADLLGGELPLGPFANQPYHYKLTEEGYRLWSVGPDGIDDNGEIPLTRRGDPDARGDMVAGQLFPK